MLKVNGYQHDLVAYQGSCGASGNKSLLDLVMMSLPWLPEIGWRDQGLSDNRKNAKLWPKLEKDESEKKSFTI